MIAFILTLHRLRHSGEEDAANESDRRCLKCALGESTSTDNPARQFVKWGAENETDPAAYLRQISKAAHEAVNQNRAEHAWPEDSAKRVRNAIDASMQIHSLLFQRAADRVRGEGASESPPIPI
jgi:hypothetical protein